MKCLNPDERSQWSKRVLAWSSQRFSEALSCFKDTFGGIPIVNFFGDLGQLGPFGDKDLHEKVNEGDSTEKKLVMPFTANLITLLF